MCIRVRGCSVAGAGVAFFAFSAFGSEAVVVFEVWSLVASVVFFLLVFGRGGGFGDSPRTWGSPRWGRGRGQGVPCLF